MTSCALVVIDMQNCYFEDAVLAQARGNLTAACNVLIRKALHAGVLVVNLRTGHLRDRSTWTLSMLEDDQGFSFRGDSDAQFLDELHIAGTVAKTKTRNSSFVGTDLDAMLRDRGVDTVVLAGVPTHTCIAATATDAYAHNFHVVLVADAISSHCPNVHHLTLHMLRKEYRQPVLTTHEVSRHFRVRCFELEPLGKSLPGVRGEAAFMNDNVR